MGSHILTTFFSAYCRGRSSAMVRTYEYQGRNSRAPRASSLSEKRIYDGLSLTQKYVKGVKAVDDITRQLVLKLCEESAPRLRTHNSHICEPCEPSATTLSGSWTNSRTPGQPTSLPGRASERDSSSLTPPDLCLSFLAGPPMSGSGRRSTLQAPQPQPQVLRSPFGSLTL